MDLGHPEKCGDLHTFITRLRSSPYAPARELAPFSVVIRRTVKYPRLLRKLDVGNYRKREFSLNSTVQNGSRERKCLKTALFIFSLGPD